MKTKIFIILIIITSVSQAQITLDNDAKKALNAFHGKNYTFAIELYEKSIKYSPILKMEYFINLSKSYIALRQYEKAIKTTRHGIRFNQVLSWEIYYQQGYAFYKLKEYTKAIIPIKKAIDISSKNSYLYNFMGLIHLYSKDYKNAEKNFVIATTYSPENPVYLCNLASSYEMQTNLNDALITYERALTFDAKNVTLAKTETTRIRNYLILKNRLPTELKSTNNINAISNGNRTQMFQYDNSYSNNQTNKIVVDIITNNGVNAY